MRSSSPGILFLGILAVLFGLIGAYGAKKYLEQQQVTPPPPTLAAETTITVPLELPAKRPVSAGPPAGVTTVTGRASAQALSRKESRGDRSGPPTLASSAATAGSVNLAETPSPRSLRNQATETPPPSPL